MSEQIVIVGFGPVAARLVDELLPAVRSGKVGLTVVGEEAEAAYNRVLVADLGVGRTTAEALALSDAAELTAQGADIRLGVRVKRVDRARQQVLLSDGGAVRYDRLVFATGSRPVIPNLTGINPDPTHPVLPAGVTALRDLRDAEALRRARETAVVFAEAGATCFVTAVVQDYGWSRPTALDAEGMEVVGEGLAEIDDLCAEHGLVQALHPHVDTLVETAADVDLALEHTSARFCLDTGHLQIGGVDPVEFARRAGDRVAHVHLKDVDTSVAQRVLDRELTLVEGVQLGMFRPLGAGEVAVDEVVVALEESGYEGWYVLEQDCALTQGLPAEGRGPVEDVRVCLDYLQQQVAPRVPAAPGV